MPILVPDPWRERYFVGYKDIPKNEIPLTDIDAYRLNPAHRWIYNKLYLADLQKLQCGPFGTPPSRYPVFAKPVYNLRSMGIDSAVIADEESYRALNNSGFMWMELLEGDHISSDLAVVKGEARWFAHAKCATGVGGTFEHFAIGVDPIPKIEDLLAEFLSQHLPNYTGMINVETIGGRIIEMHLRFTYQWPDLYGPDFVPALIQLYDDGSWPDVLRRRPGFCVVAFDAERSYVKPSTERIEAIEADPMVSSTQLPFFEDVAPASHAMPPGGFRIAIVNAWGLEAGRAARDALREAVLDASNKT